MSLPKLTLTLKLNDPAWEAELSSTDSGAQVAVNMDSYYKDFDVEVEVVQLNLNTGGMRVRFPWPSKHAKNGVRIISCDVSIDHFYKSFAIVAQTCVQ